MSEEDIDGVSNNIAEERNGSVPSDALCAKISFANSVDLMSASGPSKSP